jgi:diguanylate cyclase (GGDEF)-like protein
LTTIGSLARTIRQHPWASLQDATLIAAALMVGLLLALEYDVVVLWDDLDSSQRRLRMEEIFALTVALGAGIFAFILRRMHEEQRDLERRLRAEYEARESRTLAMQDPLTALPNRRALEAAMATATESGDAYAFYLLDLNGFKRVNDEHGHAVGDEVLRAVAGRLRAAARRLDLLARLGGDEFAVVAADVANRKEAAEIGDRLVGALDDPIQLGDRVFSLGVAIGAALYPEDGATMDEIMQRADLAMYRAKSGKGSRLRLYEAEPGGLAVAARA